MAQRTGLGKGLGSLIPKKPIQNTSNSQKKEHKEPTKEVSTPSVSFSVSD